MKCLEEYREIFKTYPLNDKRSKKKRHPAFHAWRVDKNDYTLLKTEVCGFINDNRAIINSVFIKQAICPLINECIDNNENDFINELIKTVGIDNSQKNSLKDIIDIYCEYDQWEKTPIQIVNEFLRHSNSDLLLEFKFDLMQEQILYSLHELPVGIIDIGILSRQNYTDFFDEWEDTAKKLNKKNNIDKVKLIYEAYFIYLDNRNEFTSFEEYLNRNKVDYDFLFCPEP